MLEIPETIVMAGQMNDVLRGRRVSQVIAAASPHKFAWYYGDPADYDLLLRGRAVQMAKPYGSRVEIELDGDIMLHYGEGVNLRYYPAGEKQPEKHQMSVEFNDGSALIATVAMYGGLWAFPAGAMDEDFYYSVSKTALPPLADAFDYAYFLSLFDDKSEKMSAKAFLATQQRIPGLGNGVLQDILLNAKIHPRKKMNTLSEGQRRILFDSVKSTLTAMVAGGGRDVERDLHGNPGGYKTKLSKNNKLSLCPDCGGTVKREAYLGGNVYYCEQCQQL